MTVEDGDQRMQVQKTIALVGMMGSGKTAVGKVLAQRLGAPFLDSDEEIERAANMTIAEIFARDGEPFFRLKESQVIARLLIGAPCVLSTGGGAFLQPANRSAIAAHGCSVWLRAGVDLLWSRVRHKTTRPLLMTSAPRETLAALCAAREPVYALADISVESQPGLSVEDMAGRVLAAIAQARPDVVTPANDTPDAGDCRDED
jgi:shikimate kinase